MKQCSKCQVKKDCSDFDEDKSHKDGYASQCKECRKEYKEKNKLHYTKLKRQWRKENPGKNKKTLNDYYYRHKDTITIKNKEKRQQNLIQIRARERELRTKSRYGITLEEKEALLEKQGGKCAICRKKISGYLACIDHDHKTGKARGLLCRNCNMVIGKIESELFPKFLCYLEQYKQIML